LNRRAEAIEAIAEIPLKSKQFRGPAAEFAATFWPHPHAETVAAPLSLAGLLPPDPAAVTQVIEK